VLGGGESDNGKHYGVAKAYVDSATGYTNYHEQSFKNITFTREHMPGTNFLGGTAL
jgi:hypothetical protein